VSAGCFQFKCFPTDFPSRCSAACRQPFRLSRDIVNLVRFARYFVQTRYKYDYITCSCTVVNVTQAQAALYILRKVPFLDAINQNDSIERRNSILTAIGDYRLSLINLRDISRTAQWLIHSLICLHFSPSVRPSVCPCFSVKVYAFNDKSVFERERPKGV